MSRILTILCILCVTGLMQAQELNCVVVINAEQTGKSDLQVFKTLERELTEFMNRTQWTNQKYKQQELIDCSINIIISNVNSSNNSFEGSIQVQSSRPVFNSNYDTPILNFNDRQFNFEYTEFQPLNYNPNTFQSNLVSVLTFYAYTIIGLDASSYTRDGGEPYFVEARRIVSTAQQGNNTGWRATDGPQSRFRLNEDLLSPNFKAFQEIMYTYHRTGLDYFSDNPKEAKQSISVTLSLFRGMYSKRPNNFLSRVFFDAKAEEIASMYSGGPQVNITELVDTLNRVAPTKSTFWRQIKF